MAKGLDFSKFKKVASDKKSTTMMHPHGHRIVIAHDKLSPDMRKSLDEMPVHKAEGGMVESIGKENYKDKKKPAKLAGGGDPVMPEEPNASSSVETPDSPDQIVADAAASPPPTQDQIFQSKVDAEKAKDTGAGRFLGGASPEETVAKQMASDAQYQNFAGNNAQQSIAEHYQHDLDYVKSQNAIRAKAGISPMPLPVPPASISHAAGLMPGQPNDPNRVPGEVVTDTRGVPPALPPGSNPNGDGGLNYESAYNLGLKGINQQQAAETQMSQGKQQALDNGIAAKEAALKIYQDQTAHTTQEIQHFMEDYKNQHIDPNHYMNSMGTGERILKGIGIILGGMGAGGLGSAENPVLKHIQSQISNDIEAQKANMGKTENLMNANFKLLGNMRDAADMTRIMQTAIVGDKIEMEAQKVGTPMAMARAAQAKAALMKDIIPLKMQMDMRRSMMQFAGVGGNPSGTPGDNGAAHADQASRMATMYEAMGNHEQAKSLRDMIVPGVGVGTVPVPAEVRGQLIARQNLNNMASDFYKWAQQHSGSLDPAQINVGKTKAAELQSAYRNSINGGVFKKGEQEFIDNIVDSDPTKFFNGIRVLPKLKEVIHSNGAQLNTLKQGYGLPPSQLQGPAENATMGGRPYVQVVKNGVKGWVPAKKGS